VTTQGRTFGFVQTRGLFRFDTEHARRQQGTNEASANDDRYCSLIEGSDRPGHLQ
jgi:hypothetical protein